MAVRRKTVFAAGTFDGLHPGHLRFLEFARRRGGELRVVVARDSSARKVRGHSPVFGEKERLELVRALKLVDGAILGSEKNWFDSVRKVNPDVIVLGHDQKIDVGKLRKFVEQNKLRAREIVRASKVKRSKYSGSRLREKNPKFHEAT